MAATSNSDNATLTHAPVACSSDSASTLPELLAPAGDWDCARAAVENGADAVYFGLDKFNARMRADNFTEADLPRLMEFLHRRGVRGYVTLNTLVFENELVDAERYLRTMIAAGVDAAIVQDVGICRLIRELSPDFPIHASTQMTITSSTGVEFARKLGCQVVVLARELSIKDIEHIQSRLRGSQSTLPLEVFVHGALCVAYSGQCLTSESLGGRSANRGECAQACRMPYDLISDGKPVALGDRRYLLSPQDLAGLEVLPELTRLGVGSLKIEGRLKAPEYVANITRVYRGALDRLIEPNTTSAPLRLCGEEETYSMEMAFSRGLYTGWFGGINNQKLVHARFGKKRGVYLGQVHAVHRDSVSVLLEGVLKPGDGVVFDAGRPDEAEEGGRVYEVRPQRAVGDTSRAVTLFFGRGDIDFARIRIGDRLWKTSDPALEKQWRQSYGGDTPRFQRPISLEVHGRLDQPLTIIARDEQGHIARANSTMMLAQADKQPLTNKRLRQQLGRLGGTPFKLGELEGHLKGEVMMPVSELNRLRRELVAELEQQRTQPKRWTIRLGQVSSLSSNFVQGGCSQSSSPNSSPSETVALETGKSSVLHSQRDAGAPHLVILVRNLSQLEAALRCGARTVYCDFENPRKYRDAVQLAHCASSCDGPSCETFVAPPRIFKPGEVWQLEQVRSSNADGYLVRNYDHLQFFSGCRCVGDFSLNIANHLSADYFLNRFGLERITASYDLNVQQLEALLQGTPPDWFEITIHQHMPMFHMEHCVFCAFLSTGTDYRDCGRPCDKHDVRLRDRIGAEHPVKADVGCRNTVFNALAQTGAEYVEQMITLGARHFRIEFLNETPDEVERTIAKYRQLLRGEITGTQLWRELKLFNQLGVTRGQMANP